MTETTNEPAKTATPETHRILRGHVSFDTAYVQSDYPWGFKLRTERRVWIETAQKGAGKGKQRLMVQTKDPRTGRWCAVKAGVYAERVTLLEEVANPGYLTWINTTLWHVDEFLALWGAHLTTDESKALGDLSSVVKALNERVKHMTLTVVR
jgi:hypothetical protein